MKRKYGFCMKNMNLLKSNDELKRRFCPPATLKAWTYDGQDIRMAILGEIVLCPSIDLSSSCNLNCAYCYVDNDIEGEKVPLSRELSIEEYKALISELKNAGAKTINIVGAGEPTVDKNFKNIVEYISSMGIDVLVASNGIAFAESDYLLDFLNELNVSLVLKVNSFNTTLQDFLVGRNGYSELRDKTLQKIISKGFNSDSPSRFGVNMILIKGVEGEVFSVFKYCRENNIVFIAGDYMPTGRTKNSKLNECEACCGDSINTLEYFELIGDIGVDEIRKDIIEYDDNNDFRFESPSAYISGIPCVQGLGLHIDNMGKIWHCPARKINIAGKAVETPLGDWRKGDAVLEVWKNDFNIISYRDNYDGLCNYKKRRWV